MQYNMIDPNSAQYKEHVLRLRSLRMQVVLWLLVLALGVMLVPLVLITGWVRTDVTRLSDELAATQSLLSAASSPSAEVSELSADIAGVNQVISLMQTVTIPSGVNWPLIIGAAAQYDPNAIEITSLTQNNQQIQLSGRAINNDAVVQYQKSLIDSGAFRDVQVLSLSSVEPTPVPTAPAKNKNKDQPETPAATPEPLFGEVVFVIDMVVEMVAGADAGGTSP